MNILEKYRKYVIEFQEGNEAGLFFIDNQLSKYLESNQENQSEIEHILDYLYSTNKKFEIGYKTIKEKSRKWAKKLSENIDNSDEIEGEDYEVIKDFKDGFRFVSLKTEKAYKREGLLMSHCVASYFGRDDEIYSLRDKKNNPHATLSKSSQQIKGKGNGEIKPKYVEYVVSFLEELGIEVRDSEMKNLGYVNFEEHKSECRKEDLFRDKYFYKKDIDKLKNKNQLKFWRIFGLVDFKSNFNFSLRFDVQESIQSLSTNAGRDYSTNAGGYGSTNAGRYKSTNVGGDGSTNVGGDYSTNAGGDYSTNAGGYGSTNVGGRGSTNAGGYGSTNAGGDYSTNAGGYGSTNAGRYKSTNVGGDGSTNAGGDGSTIILKGVNAIGIAQNKSKIKGVIGSAFALPIYNKNNDIIDIISVFVDGKKIKANVFYCVKDEKLVEWHEGIFD